MSRVVPPSMTAAWKAQAKIGGQRPVVRATIQHQGMKFFDYDTAWEYGSAMDNNRHRKGQFKSFIFGNTGTVRELPNIKSCEWERTLKQDAATCTLVMVNTEITPIGSVKSNDTTSDFDLPGWFTYNRGDETVDANRWGYTAETGWNHAIMPDMVVKTWEGYGCDPSVTPSNDPHLVQSGTWMIDKVTFDDDGTITLEMRDLARLLLDQIVFPPAIPITEYPLSWEHVHSENVASRDVAGGKWLDKLNRHGKAYSSNDKFVGKGFTNAPLKSYVNANGVVDGQGPLLPIMAHGDGDWGKVWTSVGMDNPTAYAWWQFDWDGAKTEAVSGLRLQLANGPYLVYVSIHNGDKWVGKKKIPWKRNGESGTVGNVDIEANIPFVTKVIGDRNAEFDVILPRKYHAAKIRLTFTRLIANPGEHPYRAGLREFKVYTGDWDKLKFVPGEVLKVVGNYGDWTQVVKWICAWGGWYWPPHSTGMDFIKQSEERTWLTYRAADPVLPKGRAWGDFMRSGTYGTADLTVDQFDKKPLFEVISYVRDLLGFVFFIDEAGGVVWRMPNLYSLGNYLSPTAVGDNPGKRGRGGRTSEIVTLDENETLLSYQTVLDSTNLRERIFVANAVGGVGIVIQGWNPNWAALGRVAGWSNQNFTSKYETRVMADMINAQQMFSYRTGQATIPGYPKIQVDDQVRIFERMTNETFYHYVTGIKSTLDMESGEWTYDLTTHWLGERPQDAWVVDVEEWPDVTKRYLNAVGYTASGPEDRDDA